MHAGLRKRSLRPGLRGLQYLPAGLRVSELLHLRERHVRAELRQWDVRAELRRELHHVSGGLHLPGLYDLHWWRLHAGLR